jgi:hypothetical protein
MDLERKSVVLRALDAETMLTLPAIPEFCDMLGIRRLVVTAVIISG